MEHKPTDQASSAGTDATAKDAKCRIAELEEEVARLQGQLQGSADIVSPPSTDFPPLPAASRFKMILVGIITGAILLTLIGVIFSFLSQGFDSAARRAAEVISPQPEQHKEQRSSSQQAEPVEEDELAKPPGL